MDNFSKAIIALCVVVAAATLTICVAVDAITRPYEQGNDTPIPNAVTTCQWDHPPVEGSVIK